MMKKLLTAAVLLAAAAGLASCGEKGEVLNLYTWEGMFPDEVLSSFEADTGIHVNYINFDYNETMLSKLEAANGGDYDLIFADDYILAAAIEKGLVSPLDKAKLSNYSGINPLYQGQFYDPDDTYIVPYGAGVQTIVYRPDAVNGKISGYADLWDASFAGKLGIIGNYRVINGMALKILGKSYNTEALSEITAAGEKLQALAPNIRLIKDDYIEEDLLSGEIDAAVMYTSQVTVAKMTDPSLEIVYPEEGIGFGIMGMFIPSHAPHADAAYKFLDYVLDPQRGAECFEYLGYFCTLSAAEPYISEEYKDFLTLPEDISMDNMEMIETVSQEAEDAHLAAWTAFRDLCN